MINLYNIIPSKLSDIIVKILCNKNQGKSKLLRNYYSKKYNTIVGEYTYGGCFNRSFNRGGTIKIGRYCSIADNVHYFGANHPLYSLSTSAYFYNRKMSKYNVKDVNRSTLIIENDVWIGYGVLITCSCKKIGTGAVIGAGSVVTHDIPNYAIVAGNPARIIRYRFNEETSILVNNSKWWNYNFDELMEYYCYFDNPVDFVNQIDIKNNEVY